MLGFSFQMWGAIILVMINDSLLTQRGLSVEWEEIKLKDMDAKA